MQTRAQSLLVLFQFPSVRSSSSLCYTHTHTHDVVCICQRSFKLMVFASLANFRCVASVSIILSVKRPNATKSSPLNKNGWIMDMRRPRRQRTRHIFHSGEMPKIEADRKFITKILTGWAKVLLPFGTHVACRMWVRCVRCVHSCIFASFHFERLEHRLQSLLHDFLFSICVPLVSLSPPFRCSFISNR